MGRRYSGNAAATNTTSTTVPMFTLVGAATTRLFAYDLISGSNATPADNYAQFAMRRVSARGTQSATWTPTALDSANPASLAVFDTTWSVNPTITASSDLLQISHNQRATFRWVAAPLSELVVPATAGAGLAWMAAGSNATASYNWTLLWEE
jgi:hypothetical protein